MTISKPLVCNLSIVQIVENGSVNFLEATKTILGSRVGRNVLDVHSSSTADDNPYLRKMGNILYKNGLSCCKRIPPSANNQPNHLVDS